MLSKFSVKKPLTVFVCVILIIVLGVVSFLNMTPDLLPNMDLPYAVILTVYPGQTPETVEMTVSKPLEQIMSTIDGVSHITSTSADNYSLLMIEFEDGTDMNTATVDMRSGLDTVSDAWPDAVGSPTLIKVNPNVLPVAMAAVDYEGKDRNEISDFVSGELMNRLEGIDGVASVSDKGLVTEKENIVLSQKKIDALNKKINTALDDRFKEAEDKIADAKKELDENIKKAEEGSAVISDSIDEIKNKQSETAKLLSDAQTQADEGREKLLSAKMQLLDRKAGLTSTKQQLETTYQTLLSVKEAYDGLKSQQSALLERIASLKDLKERYEELKRQLSQAAEGSQEYQALIEAVDRLKEELEQLGVDSETIDKAIADAEESLKKIDESISRLTDTISKLGGAPATAEEFLNKYLSEIPSQIAQINGGIAQLDSALDGLDQKTVTVSEALATISEQRSNADFQMSSALSELSVKQSEVQSALTKLNEAKAEVDKSLETLNDQKKAARDKADMTNNVTLENIGAILTAQNFSMPAGYVTDSDNNRYLVRVGDEVADEKELSQLELFDTKIDGIGVIRLNDVADVFLADNSDEIFVKINNRDGIVLSFSKQSNIATSTVCDNIDAAFNEYMEQYQGLSLTYLYSQGDYINVVVSGVWQNLLSGAALAIILLLIFLRDIKPTAIVALSIPISVIFAVVLMYFSGVTLNMISLSGLAIGVGMLVDNSVVVIENIYRLRGMGYSPVKAAVNGARQVAGAIAASTLTTICVFFPIVFVQGITRQIFSDMALTIGYSLVASLIVALTLVPAMSQRMLRKIRPQKDVNDSKILNAYGKSLGFVLRHKVISIIVVVALLGLSFLGAFSSGFSFMPEMSTTEVQVTVTLEDNADFDDTVKVAEKVNAAMKDVEEFETVGVVVGRTASLMGISTGSSTTDAGHITAYGVIKKEYTKQSKSISERMAAELEAVNGEVSVGSGSTSSFSTVLGDGTVKVMLYGDSLDTLKSTAEDMAKKLGALEEIDEVDNGIGATSPEIRVTVDKKKAAAKGLTVAQVFTQVAAAVSSEKTSTTLSTEGGKELDVVVVKDDSQSVSADKVGGIMITYTDEEGNSKETSLSSVSEISEAESLDTVMRQDQKRYIAVSGTVKEGYTLTDASNAAEKLFSDYELPTGCSISFEGSNKMTMEAVSQLSLMLLLGVILIYLIMVAQFQSLKSPFIIMFTIPLAFTGGFLALFFTGFDVSVVSMIGFIMLCGIIVNNGIVLVDYINKLRLDGVERRDAIIQAGKTRMRPILITALTTILGLSVMALGIGTGAEITQPMAVVCIGGLIYATFMTLYIVPVIYDAFNKKELRKIEDEELEKIDE